MPIKVIDLFAGPGGLGEGFSSLKIKGKNIFKIALSIEKESSAYRTLLLRAVFRQFAHKNVPEAYYSFLRGELGKTPEEQLYKLPEFQDALINAKQEAQQITLGEHNQQDIYKKINNVLSNEECILIGGPPCQAYSLVGRSRNYGSKQKQYSASDDHRNFLYQEYLKIISKFQPQIFIMENVKGMLSAKVDGCLIFNSILNDLQDPFKSTKVTPAKGRKKNKYKIYSLTKKTDGELIPSDFIIRTENHGLPQARHRVILLGVRNDLDINILDFMRLQEVTKKTTVKQVLSDLPKLRSRLSKSKDSTINWRDSISSISSKSLAQLATYTSNINGFYKHFAQQLTNIKHSPELTGADKGLVKEEYNKEIPHELKEWFKDDRLDNYVINHEARGHMVGDLHRYLYYSSYAEFVGTSPKSTDLPKALWPKHKNFGSGKFSDRFRVQLANNQGTTVTCHISKDGHYFIHYDPNQCRSLTVREAARIQTFPDNYYFVGNRTQQYTQVGNAVPPYLARKIANLVYMLLNNIT